MRFDVLKGKKVKNFNDLLSICIGKSLSNQLMFSKLFVFNSKWTLDFDNKKIYFKDIDKSFNMEIIGTESIKTNTWLWSWADPGIPFELTKKARKLKDKGIKYNIDILKNEGFFLDREITGKNLSLIAAILDDEDSVYYRGSFPGGYIYMYIYGLPKVIFNQLDESETIILFNQIRNRYNLNDRLMVQSFLELNRNVIGIAENSIISIYNDKSVLIIEFDKNKISNMLVNKKNKSS